MQTAAARVGALVEDVDTPAVLIDLDVVDANIARLQRYLEANRVAARPHIKTHKSVEIAHRQLQAGAVGVTCQKLSEAEVMVDAGVNDVLITYNLLGDAKLTRLAMLAQRAKLTVTLDNETAAVAMSEALERFGASVDVLVECDSGGKRCGVQSPAAAAVLGSRVHGLPSLRFAGLMTYPSGPGVGDWMLEAKRACEAHGLQVEVMSGGGTPGVWDVDNLRGFTEYRAGVYVYNDRSIVAKGAASWEDCALTVLTTVVSRPTDQRAVLDAGSKALTSDTLGLDGHGRIREYPEAAIVGLSEEHGVAEFATPSQTPLVGAKVRVIPNHACVVSNLFDEVYGVRAGRVEAVLPISARGHVR